ncbi:DNA-binding transcriptional regulator, LysR family [Proteiniborus ethanoligenes]|uniref:DNA-binding transcriptional regulator, LysR family n=1 Tax=Proteiniborus ethanoligenes TaxID=415015 RepID=A0A1H3MWQ5_9FIRM|nr:LysR family transcriptional regulator [Proteiniborus ethanoligenes]TAH63703.1 MAG: LysR family transcriptional regulator [Gottschalkiaceae bacterium]SDY81137.1 DNA-binding transcriptional regulator, LysR family [Proteiniborus ethanoligenes]
MLDMRIDSFLAVCKNKSYTKASKELSITQPAITQHIQSLERHYNCKFFEYSNRQLRFTAAGELFYKHILNAKANEQVIMQKLQEINNEKKTLKFAATLTIGEFTLPPILGEFMNTFKEYNITMYVDNTRTVLQMLENGEIYFALIEGLFNKADYETRLCKRAPFILVAPVTHHLVKKKPVLLDELKDETVIIREAGSGSREVLERGLFDKNHTLKDFKKTIEIGNVNVIKEMIKKEIGISFMYEDAVREEIKRGELAEITIQDFVIQREFNFIHLKNEIMRLEFDALFSFFKNSIN